MDNPTYQRFNQAIEIIFDSTEYLDLNREPDSCSVSPEALIPCDQLRHLCSEAAKLKTQKLMEYIPTGRVVKLLKILERNVQDGANVCPLADPDDDEEQSRLWSELTEERVMRSADASLVTLYIMTSSNMPKEIYLEDIINVIILFIKYQLQNTIYPSFDPEYRITYKKSQNQQKERNQKKDDFQKTIMKLYTKLNMVISLLAELLNIQLLTDISVIQVSSFGISAFFVEGVSDLQLSTLKLITKVFYRFEKYRGLILENILSSTATLQQSRRGLRSYRLTYNENIQMFTVLVLQLIQCIVSFPEGLDAEEKEEVKQDVLLIKKYENTMRTSSNFLYSFFKKCTQKNEVFDNRPLLENFVQDLLTTVNKPEWPVAELLLCSLGGILVKHFSDKTTELSLRVLSLEYFGLIVAKLRKFSVSTNSQTDPIGELVKEIEEKEQIKSDEYSDKKKKMKCPVEENCREEKQIQLLQQVLVEYLAANGERDPALYVARDFYIAQWFHAIVTNPLIYGASKKKKLDNDADLGKSNSSRTLLLTDEESNSEIVCLVEKRKKNLKSKIISHESALTYRNRTQTCISHENAELITRYFASARPFSQKFHTYLKQILLVLTENHIALRVKAIKCLKVIIEADPTINGHLGLQVAVQKSLLDHSPAVREATIDLVGKSLLSSYEPIYGYYDLLLSRILDKSVAVRKQAIKIFHQICIKWPNFPKVPEICVKMIWRVNDEEGIRKLVEDVFQNLWFTPVDEMPQLDVDALNRKIMNIIAVVMICQETGLDCLENLLLNLFKPKEDKNDCRKHIDPPMSFLKACQQIVTTLIEYILKLEELIFKPDNMQAAKAGSDIDKDKSETPSRCHLLACFAILHIFTKTRPELVLTQAAILETYLTLKCQTEEDTRILCYIVRILEVIIPLMEHPSEIFLAQLEEDSVKLILLQNKAVVENCLPCLASVVNNVTHNFKLISDCFKMHYGHAIDFKMIHEDNPSDLRISNKTSILRRSLFVVGLLLRHFDFTKEEVRQDLPVDIKEQVFEMMIYFACQPNKEMQTCALQAIGSICVRHYEFMLKTELKTLYCHLLKNETFLPTKVQILKNIEIYLKEEEKKMIKLEKEWNKLSAEEDLKEMHDELSGMASTIIQMFLNEILESFLHPLVLVRQEVLKVIQLILQNGLTHPAQIIPYLICMSSDEVEIISGCADKLLQDIEKKYPGFIQMKFLQGIFLSYKFQRIIQGTDVVRGYIIREEEEPRALNGFSYSVLRNNKKQRRAIVFSLLKQFDESVISKSSLSQKLYLADNLAYFPFQIQDEAMFIIHHIELKLSVSGANTIQAFEESLLPPKKDQSSTPKKRRSSNSDGMLHERSVTDAKKETDITVIMGRLPEDVRFLQGCITDFQSCILLSDLKQHLQGCYGMSDVKVAEYSPSKYSKAYDKALKKHNVSCFDPESTLKKLNEGPITDKLDETARRHLVQEYLMFKEFMLEVDPCDSDDDDDDFEP